MISALLVTLLWAAPSTPPVRRQARQRLSSLSRANVPTLPASPIVALVAHNIDGANNSTLALGDALATWSNLGSDAVPGFTQTTASNKPKVKKSTERSVSFDGVFDSMTSTGSKAPLGFIHSTGVFDLVIVMRRTSATITDERRIFGGAEGQAGLCVLLSSAAVNTEASIWLLLGSGVGTINNWHTTVVPPMGVPFKMLIRGDGSNLKISTNFSTFSTQAFGAALGTGSSFYDYTVGGCKSAQTTPLTLEGDVFDVLLYNRNLTAAELTQITSFLNYYIGTEM